MALLSLDEPRSGNVSGELFIDVDGEVGDTGPSKPSPWTMIAATLVSGVLPRSFGLGHLSLLCKVDFQKPSSSYEPLSADSEDAQ